MKTEKNTGTIAFRFRQVLLYYASVYSCERDIPDISSTHSDKPVNIKINIIRKRLAVIGRKEISRT